MSKAWAPRAKGSKRATRRSKRGVSAPPLQFWCHDECEQRGNEPAPAHDSFPIAGSGASAGGLEAFSRLRKSLPANTGMGFVASHLDPVNESALAKLLAKATAMPVRELANNAGVESNRVYNIPPNKSLLIAEGILKLLPRKKSDGSAWSHRCFSAIARRRPAQTVDQCVVLSGTASNGTLGCEAIKAEGGITLAQGESAKDERMMPRVAVARSQAAAKAGRPE